jgi:hypothetical protein
MPNLINKPLAVAAGFAAAIAGLAIFAIAPLFSDIKAINGQIIRRRAQIADYDLRIGNARNFMRFAARQKTELEQIAGVFADSQMPLDMINSLENAAKDSNVSVEFSPAGQSNLQIIKIEINASGAIFDTLRFIEKIENSPYLAEIESADIRKEVPVGGASLAEFSGTRVKTHILLNVYAKS